MNTDRKVEAILGILGDEHARAILAATSREPMTAKSLSEEIGVSKATIYRRAHTLLEHELLSERSRTPANGGHVTIYEANLKRLGLRLTDGRFDVRVQTTDAPERATRRVAARISEALIYVPWPG